MQNMGLQGGSLLLMTKKFNLGQRLMLINEVVNLIPIEEDPEHGLARVKKAVLAAEAGIHNTQRRTHR